MRKTRSFLSHLYIKVIMLPRQARDRHRKSTQNKYVCLRRNETLNGVPYDFDERVASEGGLDYGMYSRRGKQQRLFGAILNTEKASFYQDGLGTNVGSAEGKGTMRLFLFLPRACVQGSWSLITSRRTSITD